MFVERSDEGVWIRGIPFWVVDTLMRLPEWLQSEDPRVRDRLIPTAYEEDDDHEAEWQRHARPDLEHLFATRQQIVGKDLQGLQVEQEGEPAEMDAGLEFDIDMLFCLFLPAPHVAAWLSCLQAATHSIFILESLTEDQLGEDPIEEPDAEKQVALLRMAALQELIVQLLEE